MCINKKLLSIGEINDRKQYTVRPNLLQSGHSPTKGKGFSRLHRVFPYCSNSTDVFQMRVSEEAEKNHLELAKKQGDAYKAALDEMTQNVAQRGSEKRAGHFLVSYAVEKPEGMYHVMGEELSWHEPDDENIHIEII